MDEIIRELEIAARNDATAILTAAQARRILHELAVHKARDAAKVKTVARILERSGDLAEKTALRLEADGLDERAADVRALWKS